MRAGPLSVKKLIKKLNAGFVNTWIIIPEFEDPDQFFDDLTDREWAKTIATEFTYPVDSIVLSSAGKPMVQGEFAKFHSADGASVYLKMVTQVTTK